MEFATDPTLLQNFLYCKWDVAYVQVQSFESMRGSAGSSKNLPDPKGRHYGIVAALRNAMCYMAAFAHVVYRDVLEPLALNIQDHEHLFRTSAALVVYLINEEIGVVFRAIPLKSTIAIDGVLCSLAGPIKVAEAIRCAGARLISIFNDKKLLRELQITYDEEAGDRSEVAALIATVIKSSKRKNGDELVDENEGTKGGNKNKKQSKLDRANQELDGAAAQLDKGSKGKGKGKGGHQQEINLGNNKKNNRPLDLGGGVPGNQKQSIGICNRHMAGLLGVKDVHGEKEKCLKSKEECRFSHKALNGTLFDDARRSVLAMGDVALRGRINLILKDSEKLFKQ
jgi:hypothetical protein